MFCILPPGVLVQTSQVHVPLPSQEPLQYGFSSGQTGQQTDLSAKLVHVPLSQYRVGPLTEEEEEEQVRAVRSESWM